MKLISLTGKEVFNNQSILELPELRDSAEFMKLLQMQAHKENRPVIDIAKLKESKKNEIFQAENTGAIVPPLTG